MSRIAALAAVGALAMIAAGCGSSDDAAAGRQEDVLRTDRRGLRAEQAKAPAGPINFEVENTGTSKVTELEVLDGETILGEVENLSDGLSGQLLADPGAGRIHALLPRRRQREGTLTVSGELKADEQPRGGRGDRPVPRLPRGEHHRAGRRNGTVRRRGRRRRSRQGEVAVRGRPHPVRADRAGGRVLRRPRPPHRRARKRRSGEANGAASTGSRRRSGKKTPPRAWRRSPNSCWPTSKNCRQR